MARINADDLPNLRQSGSSAVSLYLRLPALPLWGSGPLIFARRRQFVLVRIDHEHGQQLRGFGLAAERDARQRRVNGTAAKVAVRSWASKASNSEQCESANRKYPTVDPKSRLPSLDWRKCNASHGAADAGRSLVSASHTKSSRASIAGRSWRVAAWDNHVRRTTPEPVLPTGRKACSFR
jgi:hypothetical protein